MRWWSGVLAAPAMALVMVMAACGGDDGGGTTSAGRDVGGAVDENQPAPLAGDTDTDPEHWSEGEPWEPPFGSTFRAYGGDAWSVVADFPRAMNGCDGGQARVSWRSLGGPLYAAVTDYPSEPDQQTFATPDAPVEGVDSEGWVTAEADEPAQEGTMVLNACEQPVFRTTETNVLEDFVLEVTEHTPEV